MRKGTAMIAVGAVLLVPPALVLSLTALTRTAAGRMLLSGGLAFSGVESFGIYWDSKVVSITAGLGSALVLLGLWKRTRRSIDGQAP